MQDLVKLHTYYVYEGDGAAVTQYWERMTRIRLQYLANPGPAATALRVKGTPTSCRLITADGIASSSTRKTRLMPVHAWDWSIPTPFSQGWRVDDKIYVGGQISADRQGRALAAGDAAAQTRNTLDYIQHVLEEGGGGWGDVTTLKIAYRHVGDDAAARRLLDTILAVVREKVPRPGPALVCLGVDLLYEGLLLEIDAVAAVGRPLAHVEPQASSDWMRLDGFSLGVRAGDESYVGGISAPGAASLVAQTEAAMERLFRTLEASAGNTRDLVKLNVYFTSEARQEGRESEEIARILGEYLPGQIDAVAVARRGGT
jgi:enamine deaminase RidA (YjgF/YER057c/UK114 family)